MAAIAAFRRIEVSKLEALRSVAEIKVEKKLFSKKVIDNYWNFLDNNSKRLKDFNGSGYVFADLFIFLDEHKGIHLLKGEHENISNEISKKRGNATFLFSFEQKKAYWNGLDSQHFSLAELIEFNKGFSENDDLN
ncbi:MAG: hypothetical protein DI538_25130 [Azospira oryzae]|jgi:hypothetical protein|nr:MAG: hypothetical protein DI538_25130 [Azospira oryzae]